MPLLKMKLRGAVEFRIHSRAAGFQSHGHADTFEDAKSAVDGYRTWPSALMRSYRSDWNARPSRPVDLAARKNALPQCICGLGLAGLW